MRGWINRALDARDKWKECRDQAAAGIRPTGEVPVMMRLRGDFGRAPACVLLALALLLGGCMQTFKARSPAAAGLRAAALCGARQDGL
jgi:hypothetical protein